MTEEEKNLDEFSEEEYITWKIPEYLEYERTKRWYIIVGIITVGCFIYALLTENLLFAVILAMIAMIFVLRGGEEVSLVDVVIGDDGLYLGKDFYDYDEFANFSVVYKPKKDARNLYFEFKSAVRPRVSIPLDDMNPLPIRRHLLKYLEEDLERRELSLSDSLSRILKL